MPQEDEAGGEAGKAAAGSHQQQEAGPGADGVVVTEEIPVAGLSGRVDVETETMSLGHWVQERDNWRMITGHLLFFRCYLHRKVFNRWRANVRFKQFARFRHRVRTAHVELCAVGAHAVRRHLARIAPAVGRRVVLPPGRRR